MKIELEKVVDELLNNRYATSRSIISNINSPYYNEREATMVLDNIRQKVYKSYMRTENIYYHEVDDFLNRPYIEDYEIETAIKIIKDYLN